MLNDYTFDLILACEQETGTALLLTTLQRFLLQTKRGKLSGKKSLHAIKLELKISNICSFPDSCK